MCENNERYDYKTARWIQKTMQCMWILNINDAKKNRLVKYLKIENFSVSIDRASIEYQLSQVEAKLEKSKNFDWLKITLDRSKIWKKTKFLKNRAILCRNSSKHCILWIECMSMKWNVFQKHLYSTQIFQKHIFESICPQQLKH